MVAFSRTYFLLLDLHFFVQVVYQLEPKPRNVYDLSNFNGAVGNNLHDEEHKNFSPYRNSQLQDVKWKVHIRPKDATAKDCPWRGKGGFFAGKTKSQVSLFFEQKFTSKNQLQSCNFDSTCLVDEDEKTTTWQMLYRLIQLDVITKVPFRRFRFGFFCLSFRVAL